MKNEKYKISENLKYHFDNFVSRGIRGIVIFLLVGTVAFVLLATFAGMKLGEIPPEKSEFGVIWDNFGLAITGWWPFTESNEGLDESTKGRIFLFSRLLISVFGLFLTSVLIGLVSEAIENKVRVLRKGKSKVIENNHVIVIGYDERNHILLQELMNTDYKKRKILIIDNKDKEEIEEDLYSNIDVPKNIKVIIRTFELWDIEGLRKCNIDESYAVVISPMSDIMTLKALFAIKKVLRGNKETKTHVVSAIKDSECLIRFSTEKDVMIQIDALIARTISVSYRQVGLSKVLSSILSFEGSEFYLNNNKKYAQKTFGELTLNMINAVPIGILRNKNLILIPNENEKLLEGDELLYYSENKEGIKYNQEEIKYEKTVATNRNQEISRERDKKKNILIFGYNEKLNIIYQNFGKDIEKVVIVNSDCGQIERIRETATTRGDIVTEIVAEEINKCNLNKVVRNIDHIILLNDDSIDREKSDMVNMLLYLRLLNIREDLSTHYTIITELNFNQNKELIDNKYTNDFIVSSNITSMMLAQMVEDVRIRPLFLELLSTQGVNIIIKPYEEMLNNSSDLVSNIRHQLLQAGHIFLGYITTNSGETQYIYNPQSTENIKFKKDDRLILLGE